MATVKELKEYLENLSGEQVIYIGYSDDDEVSCAFYTEEDIIEQANKKEDSDDEDVEEADKFTGIDTALQYLMEMNEGYHFMELEL